MLISLSRDSPNGIILITIATGHQRPDFKIRSYLALAIIQVANEESNTEKAETHHQDHAAA